jgi:hypothetical protein
MRCSHCGGDIVLRGEADVVELTTTMLIEADGRVIVTNESEKCSECLLIEEAEALA